MPIKLESRLTISRSLPTKTGFVPAVDPMAKAHLDELDRLLRKRIFPKDKGREKWLRFFKKKLTPKRVPPAPQAWAPDSLAEALAQGVEGKNLLTLAEYIDRTTELAKLRPSFEEKLFSPKVPIDYNARAVFSAHPGITDYLFAYGFFVRELRAVEALANFVLIHPDGAKRVAHYAIAGAARTMIDQEQLNVEDYNDDDGPFLASLLSSDISLSAVAFSKAVKACIEDFVFNRDEAALIDQSNAGPIPPDLAGIKPLLIKYIQKSPIGITKNNIDYHLPVFISKILAAQGAAEPQDASMDLSDLDFAVQFREDADTVSGDISRSAVRCAAQLYFGMVVGDELDVFGAVNYFTHKFLIRGGLEIRDKRLRSDLRSYVFADKFIDLASGRETDRTQPAERRMFHRQVFNEGNAEVTEDIAVNEDFKRLWKVLMLESAKYLQRAQATYNPDSLSPQGVMQAVEDLQYNLSTSCTGMVNVIAPLVDAELNFVITRILKHPEVLQHVVPSGGTWQRAVETLCVGMKKPRPRAVTLYQKARYGERILRAIAEYSPAAFEEDATFSAFISDVDAMITTQSILQEALVEDLKETDEGEDAAGVGEHREDGGSAPAPGAKAAAGSGSDEWDF